MANNLIDGSRLIVEGAAQAGIEAYSGYPITPVNRIYFHAVERIPMVLKAPDEITALQWASGLAATGKISMTGTSRPGFSLMVETVDMAFMMELPMLIVLAQRLGPSTGSATTGAQGDLGMLNRLISGGYNIPVLSPSNLSDCYWLTGEALRVAVMLRTPVVLLTSKEMIETERSLDISKLPEVKKVGWEFYRGTQYQPYAAGPDLVPQFLPVGSESNQVRLTASTHDQNGILQKASPEAMTNTSRLNDKIEKRVEEYLHYELDEEEGADSLIVTYGITSYAAREALKQLRFRGEKVSLLIVKTLLPVAPELTEIVKEYDQIVLAEENLMGQFRKILFGEWQCTELTGVNTIGHMITPEEIVKEVAEE